LVRQIALIKKFELDLRIDGFDLTACYKKQFFKNTGTSCASTSNAGFYKAGTSSTGIYNAGISNHNISDVSSRPIYRLNQLFIL